MESYRRSALELAPDFSLRQLFALAQWIRHAECRRRHLSALGEQLARAPGAAAVHVRVVVGRRTLLVADDQHVVRAITRDLLQALGHAVILTDSEFRGVPRTARIDAVLLDVPILTEQHLKRLRQARRFSPRIIVATPLPEGAARAKLRAAGATAFVGKPFHPLALSRLIQEAMDV